MEGYTYLNGMEKEKVSGELDFLIILDLVNKNTNVQRLNYLVCYS